MRAVIRDLESFMDYWSPDGRDIDAQELRVFIDGLMVTAGMPSREREFSEYVLHLRQQAKEFGRRRGNGES